jgi:hypothetical protein
MDFDAPPVDYSSLPGTNPGNRYFTSTRSHGCSTFTDAIPAAVAA